MKKITLLFTLLSCMFGSAQIIEFQNIDFKNYLLGANVSNGRASTGTATFNPNASSHSEQSPNDEYDFDIPYFTPNYTTSFLFQVPSFQPIDANGDGEIQVAEASSITYLDLGGFNWDDNSSELHHFVNLKYLGLNGSMNLGGTGSIIDLTQNTNLEMLNLSGADLADVNIAQNGALTHLIAANAQYLEFNINSVSLPNLVFLNLNGTALGPNGLDCSQFPALEELYYYDDGVWYAGFLSSINISQNLALKRLFLQNGSITNLDLSQHNLLTRVGIRNFPNLTDLDFSNKPLLSYLFCLANGITSIDVSDSPLLQQMYCSNVNMPYLNLYGCDALETLYCKYGSYEIIDVSGCPNLTYLDIRYNQDLTYLNLKNNNPNPLSLYLQFASNILYICADENDIIGIQNQLNDFFMEDTEVNSYCTFNPGGSSETFYEVIGEALVGNTNCEESSDGYPYLKFVSESTIFGSFFANELGEYYLPVNSGSHTLTPELENPSYFNVSPSSVTVEFPATASPFEQNFCITPNGIHHDLEVTIIPLDVAVPGFDYSCKILYKNKGNQPENPSLSLAFDDSVVDFLTSSIVPDTESGGLLSWDLGTLNVFETGSIIVNFNLNSPMETPPLNSGDIIGFLSTIEGAFDDETQDNNFFNLKQDVVNSYDPNDKTCLEGQSINPEMIGDYVHYRIRFENTGTFPAQNVVIKDMIDEEKFDIATLQMVDASHDCRTRIAGQKVEFIFENIQLDFNDETNDGYVVFKIKTLPTLTLNSTISNTAEIYFDFNFPIITNTETSTFEIILSNENFTFENELILHPNPVKNTLSLTSVNGILIHDVEIYNLQGQKVMEIRNASQNLDVSRLQAGTYLIKVFTNEGSSNAKFIKN